VDAENLCSLCGGTSVGLDRMFLAVFATSLKETLEDGSTRTVLKLPSVLAPTKAAILPLVKKDYQKLHKIMMIGILMCLMMKKML
jgi:glycyl-tRNA synthetase